MSNVNKGEGNDITSNDDLEIGSIESFGGGDKGFSHQHLIMKCLSKAIDSGCVEMNEGKPATKKNRNGDVIDFMTEDTRRKFVECVKTAKNFMSRDFDDKADKKINVFLKEVETNKQYWLDKEVAWWDELGYENKKELTRVGKQVVKDMHNPKHTFLDQSINDSLEIWRDILEELNKLAKRLNDYESDRFEA